MAEERNKLKLAKLEGKEPPIKSLGEIPHISVTFPKSTCIYQPEPPPAEGLKNESPPDHQNKPAIEGSQEDKLEELKQLAEASREFQEAFDYDEVPEEVLQWIFSQDTQVATIPATSGAPGSDSIRPAVPGEKLRIDYKALYLECF